MSLNTVVGTDRRFSYTVASSKTDCDHVRDFVFSVGTNPAVVGQFAISASNNAPGWPSDPGREPIFVADTGWYTFEHVFNDVAGVLSVDMHVYSPSNVLLSTWTLSNAADTIPAVVGGNRYGWFFSSAFGFLAIDDSSRQ